MVWCGRGTSGLGAPRTVAPRPVPLCACIDSWHSYTNYSAALAEETALLDETGRLAPFRELALHTLPAPFTARLESIATLSGADRATTVVLSVAGARDSVGFETMLNRAPRIGTAVADVLSEVNQPGYKTSRVLTQAWCTGCLAIPQLSLGHLARAHGLRAVRGRERRHDTRRHLRPGSDAGRTARRRVP